ncbi:GDSL lipase/esterase [Microdochium trichocladiopsis]|uniref:GDSL lipase/esterase n=1 Tax=Microdochium trichocladiopsis TaxID=1682393 RepID=A0A9P8XZU3_9PEZI|nr:GDSL lipase/esterase [Microdochium trichocladiopsis]KAH7024673.1 GDSL lipase/esterase [Microdochium trichocladiopsis]
MRASVATALSAWALATTASPPHPPAGGSKPGLGLRKFTSLVMFGDSWTDSGLRDYQPDASGNIGKPSNNASTGGRVWPQYVEQYAGVRSYDYAVSGAMCDGTYGTGSRNGIKQNQLPTFLSNRAAVNPVTHRPALDIPVQETVYGIWIGTNDLGNAGWLAESQQPRTLPLTAYTDCVYAQLDALYASGARSFVVMNQGPIDLIPQYALPENGGVDAPRFWTDKLRYNANITQTSEKMREFIALVNEVYDLRTQVDVRLRGRYKGSQFAVFDTNALMTHMWHNPSEYFNGTAPLNVTSSIRQCGAACSAPEVRDSYMWYDELHPSEQTDRVVAREFIEVVNGKSKWATYLTG